MASLWLTYAWIDNADRDVDFVAQQLADAGIEVKIDRWNLEAGRRLWDQIDSFIRDPARSDAWAMYATENSLRSEKCQEEYAYALDRALDTRGGDFPIVGIFPGSVASDLIPAGIKTRLYVSTADADWVERVVAVVQRRPVQIPRRPGEPYYVAARQVGMQFVIEARPRVGTWHRFFGAVPLSEKDQLQPNVTYGAPNGGPVAGILQMVIEGERDIGGERWWSRSFAQQITPTQSGYIICQTKPSSVLFGDGETVYRLNL
jgi:hypothetical protein